MRQRIVREAFNAPHHVTPSITSTLLYHLIMENDTLKRSRRYVSEKRDFVAIQEAIVDVSKDLRVRWEKNIRDFYPCLLSYGFSWALNISALLIYYYSLIRKIENCRYLSLMQIFNLAKIAIIQDRENASTLLLKNLIWTLLPKCKCNCSDNVINAINIWLIYTFIKSYCFLVTTLLIWYIYVD